MLAKYDFKRPGKRLGKMETYMIQSNQSKNRKIIVQNLSWRIFFHEQVKFLKLGT